MGNLTCMQFPTTFYIDGRYDICQLLDIYGDKDVGQIEIHTAEPSILEPSSLMAVITTGKLKRNKSPGSDKITAQLLIKTRSKI
jgi:hypothetical protein